MASRGRNDRNTQTDKDIHIKQELKHEKQQPVVTFFKRGRGDCQTIDAQLLRACATPYVLWEDKLPVKMQCVNKYGHCEEPW